jgi:hypothetical protein
VDVVQRRQHGEANDAALLHDLDQARNFELIGRAE